MLLNMSSATTPKPEPVSNEEWAIRALLELLRRSREAVRAEWLRKAKEL